MADHSQNFTIDYLAIYQDIPNNISICYASYITHRNGLWQVENPLNTALPALIMQLTLYIAITRLLVLLFKYYHQPRIVAELVGGLLLGPSILGTTEIMQRSIFPFRTNMTLETLGNLGLIYYMFLVGLEMELSPILRPGKKALSIAIAGVLLPAGTGIGLFYLLLGTEHEYDQRGAIFWGVVLTVTSFLDVAKILAHLKLLHSELARMAISSASISDIFVWILFAVAIIGLNKAPVYTMLSLIAFILVSVYAVRPTISRLILQTSSGENYNECQICFLLTGVLLSAFITDMCGVHSIFGAFIFGLIIRNEDIRTTIMDRINFFVSGIMLPLFYLITGLRIQLIHILYHSSLLRYAGVLVLSFVAKIVSTFLVFLLYRMPPQKGLALGVLMNTKGVMALIILNTGRDMRALDNQSFTAMAVAIFAMTVTVGPIINFVYKPKRAVKKNKQRTIQKIKPDAELRLLACIHSKRNVSSMINLLKASNPTKKSPFCVFAVHLLEFVGRSTAMLIVHETCRIGTVRREKAQSDHIFNAFENYEKESFAVSVQPLTVVSPYASMHEDICNLAEDKRVTLIIAPFHKKPTADGVLEDDNTAIQDVNQNLLINAPCSVGIFVDRGLSSTLNSDSKDEVLRFAMLFIGGPDDREALAYAWRMAGHPDVILTVVRFLPDEDAVDLHEMPMDFSENSGQGILTAMTESEREKQLDEEYLNDFKIAAGSEESLENINYWEKVVNDGAETLGTLRTMEHDYELYIIGRRQGVVSPLTTGLTDWNVDSELGPLGDTLVSSNFASHVSLLVLQQYVADRFNNNSTVADGSALHNEPFGYE